jgi:hypothetical protein
MTNKPIILMMVLTLIAVSYSCAEQDDYSSRTSLELADRSVLKPCSESWQIYVEDILISHDGAGHGPDIGSDEWMSVVEFKLNVRNNDDLPERGSASWCEYIDDKINGHL